MSEDALHRARADGGRARDLLNDEILKTAFATLRATYAEKLFSTPVDQAQAREKLYMAHRIVAEVENHLQAIVNNGTLADAELRSLIAAAEAKQQWQNVR